MHCHLKILFGKKRFAIPKFVVVSCKYILMSIAIVRVILVTFYDFRATIRRRNFFLRPMKTIAFYKPKRPKVKTLKRSEIQDTSNKIVNSNGKIF